MLLRRSGSLTCVQTSACVSDRGSQVGQFISGYGGSGLGTSPQSEMCLPACVSCRVMSHGSRGLIAEQGTVGTYSIELAMRWEWRASSALSPLLAVWSIFQHSETGRPTCDVLRVLNILFAYVHVCGLCLCWWSWKLKLSSSALCIITIIRQVLSLNLVLPDSARLPSPPAPERLPL